MANETPDIHELFRKVREHPEFIFGTIFVPGDFPNEDVPEDFPRSQATDRLAETGNLLIGDLCGMEDDEDDATYMVRRFYQSDDYPAEVVATGLTRDEAKDMCNDPATNSLAATSDEARARTKERGAWFCGFDREE